MSPESEGYVHPELVTGTAWVEEHLGDPDVRIVDCDPREAYRRAHIPGAVGVDDNYWKNPDDRTHVMTPDQFAAEMSKRGIGDDTLVIAYDGFGSLYATRLWWVLTYYGHDRVKVLNGGWNEWLAEGRSVDNKGPAYPSATFTPKIAPTWLATAADLSSRLGQSGCVSLDVRSNEEYTGENPRGTKRGGRVPGAVHLEWLNFVTSDDIRSFKPAAELRRLFEEAGVTPEKRRTPY